MPRKLPPLNALRSFEAAARLGGFQPAAEELCVTAGAVSQQIKRLEEWFGEELFQRHVRGVSLTPTGAQLQPKLTRLLDELAETVMPRNDRSRSKRLVINSLPAFAECWLLPRLPGFQSAYPDIEIELRAEDALPSFSGEEDQVGLRYLEGPVTGLECEKILDDEIFPVCSPDLAEGLKLTGLTEAQLLYDVAWKQDWSRWWKAAGLEGTPPQGTRFSLYAMAVKSALDGGGVLMAHGALLAGELNDGRLVMPFAQKLASRGSFYLLWQADSPPTESQQAFRDWIREETGEG